jgi:two-component system, NarL family, nitrate/nitrite response regulator NarL
MATLAAKAIEVGLADKSPLVVAALKQLLGQGERFSLTVTASDGERFLDAIRRLHFDVGIIGWVMPYLDGRGVLEALSRLPAGPRIVVYTGDPDPALPRRVMALGAAAFVSKREPPERLLDAVEAVARGQMVFPFLDVRGLHQDPLGALSPRERELLSELGSGRTNAELAVGLGVSVNTVKFHLRNLFDKLHVRSRAQAVQLWHESRR